jgi:hypothetical protein
MGECDVAAGRDQPLVDGIERLLPKGEQLTRLGVFCPDTLSAEAHQSPLAWQGA